MATINEKMTAIADAIRSKTGDTEALTLDDMANGVNEVYEAGKKAQYDEFWDILQLNGTRTNYQDSFDYNLWTNDIFKPKYQIKPIIATQMFYRNSNLSGEIEAIINIDWSNCTDFVQVFQNATNLTRIGVIDLRKATDITNSFVYMTNLATIDKIIVGESLPSSLLFNQDVSLRNVLFEGVIPKSIYAPQSPLSVESLKSAITHLKDYSGTTSEYTYTTTFLTSAFNALEAEGATAEYNGVACTWAELIGYKKWNLTKA